MRTNSLSAYYIPATILSTLHALVHVILRTALKVVKQGENRTLEVKQLV